MTDIRVERKRPSVWPWVAGLLVLALLIWALIEMFGGNADAVVDSPATGSVAGEPAGATPAPFPETSDTAF